MKKNFLKSLVIIMFSLLSINVSADMVHEINNKKWIHGSEECSSNTDPAIDILKLTDASYILRQNKCTHYEAPFIYVLFGQKAVFVQDTGATNDATSFPLYQTILSLSEQWKTKNNIDSLEMIVTHSHSHSDHRAADAQFRGKQGVTLVEPNSDSVRRYFGFTDWPNGIATIDLGGRVLEVLPLPGHQVDALAVYDPWTQFILTGDSFYPGRLYIKNWSAFGRSMSKLYKYANTKKVNGFLGTHIEMKAEFQKDFPLGSTYQPNEASLLLSQEDLKQLTLALENIGHQSKKQRLDRTIIYPVK